MKSQNNHTQRVLEAGTSSPGVGLKGIMQGVAKILTHLNKAHSKEEHNKEEHNKEVKKGLKAWMAAKDRTHR